MGYLKSIGTSIVYIGAFFALITFFPGIPPNAKFAEYRWVQFSLGVRNSKKIAKHAIPFCFILFIYF